jgi:hypothetical protein
MNVIKTAKPEDLEASLAVEGDIREFVRREVTQTRSRPRTEGEEEAVRADSINTMVERASRGSVKELDNLISDLQRVRDHLTGEADRIQRAISKYVQSSDTTMETVKVMADNMGRWKDAGIQQPRPERT